VIPFSSAVDMSVSVDTSKPESLNLTSVLSSQRAAVSWSESNEDAPAEYTAVETTPVTIEMIRLVLKTSPLNVLVSVVSPMLAYFSLIAEAARDEGRVGKAANRVSGRKSLIKREVLGGAHPL